MPHARILPHANPALIQPIWVEPPVLVVVENIWMVQVVRIARHLAQLVQVRQLIAQFVLDLTGQHLLVLVIQVTITIVELVRLALVLVQLAALQQFALLARMPLWLLFQECALVLMELGIIIRYALHALLLAVIVHLHPIAYLALHQICLWIQVLVHAILATFGEQHLAYNALLHALLVQHHKLIALDAPTLIWLWLQLLNASAIQVIMLHQRVSVQHARSHVQLVLPLQLIALLAMDYSEPYPLALATRVIIAIQVLAHYVLHPAQLAHQQQIAQLVKMHQWFMWVAYAPAQMVHGTIVK